jgi:hypothetical protein
VCRLFRDIVREDTYLQYLLELDTCGYIEPSYPRMDLTYAEKIELLRNHTNRWNHPDSVVPVPYKLHVNGKLSADTLSKGIFAWGIRDEAGGYLQQIHFLQLPSRNRGTDSKTWFIHDIPANVSHFRIDPEQDLLVLLVISGTSYIHLRSMTTGAAHPKVAPGRSVITYNVELGGHPSLIHFDVHDHLVAIAFLFWDGEVAKSRVTIWDWTIGEQALVRSCVYP